jgi:hypothetical protein
VPLASVRPLASFALLMIGVTPATAEKREWKLSIEPAYALVYVDSRGPSGGGVGADASFGVTEALSIQATGFVSWHAAGATTATPAGTVAAFSAMLGLAYTVDVIRLQPSFEAAFGLLGVRSDASFGSLSTAAAVAKPSTAFGVQLGFGLDYLFTRHIAAGLILRYHAFLTDLTRIPVYLYVGPRLTFRFGG